jgi:hypothetical protein
MFRAVLMMRFCCFWICDQKIALSIAKVTTRKEQIMRGIIVIPPATSVSNILDIDYKE